MFIEMNRLPVLVIGGGMVALRKVETLSSFGARICVVAPQFCEGFNSACEERLKVEMKRRNFHPADLDGIKLAVAATSEIEVNRLAADECRKRNIPINVVDVPQLCDFFFPAVVKRGDLAVGISSGGGAPALCGRLREYLDNRLPRDLEENLQKIAALRKSLLDDGARPAEDRGYLEMIDRLMDRIRNNG